MERMPLFSMSILFNAKKSWEGKAISNFEKTLPAPQSELAQETTKDPYNFDFLTITEGYNEKEKKKL